MKRLLIAACLLAPCAAGISGQAAAAEQQFPAVLAGQALLPARTLVAPPADAGPLFQSSGKFTAANRQRVEALESLPATSFPSARDAPRVTDIRLPLPGQAVQGMSAVHPVGDGTFWLLTDNGFGGKLNSTDALLMVHRVRPVFTTGTMEVLETIFLSDPDRKVPFAISQENTQRRYLTGGDFDPESLRVIGDRLWIGEEFGPYLLEFTRDGRLVQLFETTVSGRTHRSPDHYALNQAPAVPGPAPAFDVRRSRGFEPMAATPDGRFLYVAFEGPLWDAERGAWESVGAPGAERRVVRILEFSVAERRYTGRVMRYALHAPDHVLGDIAMIDATTAVLIERDDSTEGSRAEACQGPAQPTCFNVPAAFKRVYKIDLSRVDADGLVHVAGYIDLTDIADPDRRAHLGGTTGRFTMPHLGPEGVAVVDADTIAIVNDNNLPYSMGRRIGRADDNELVLLRVPELLRAR
ncbi:MAG: esterase-like activity of phytase family protein [Alphaproteobacteria bacterium]|nr:esterase-like activity of phytase family protein [Alphaproteobacteria bacterium]